MARFTLIHTIDCDVEGFWKLFFDKSFNEKLYRGTLGFPHFEIIDQRETETTIERRVVARPKMTVPAPVAKALGSNFEYTENGTFDKATKVWRWTMTPGTLADKIRNEGTLKAEPSGAGSVKRIADITFEAKVFMLGGIIETASQKQLTDGWAASAVFMNQSLRDRPSP